MWHPGHKHGVRNATLVLDFTPNAIHAGIYEAIARGYDRDAGVALHVIIPSESTDAIKLLLDGRTDFAILDIHDLAIARERGQDIVGIMAIVEHPLASVISQPQLRDARASSTASSSASPAIRATSRSCARSSPAPAATRARVRTITIGYDAVADLLARRVAAATAFWNDEGVTLAHERPGFHVFRVEDYGAPAYPELVLCATATELRRDPSLAHGVVAALVRGYQAVLRDPASGERALETLVPGLSPPLVAEQLRAELPAFLPTGGGGYGSLELPLLRRWARWEARFGIVAHVPDVSRMFDTRFISGSSPSG